MAEKKKKDDRCTRIAKRKYDVWPSAYASGAVVQCRKGKIWKGLKEQELNDLITRIVTDSLSQLAEKTDYSKEKESGLHGWFSRQGGKGSSSGWVDCNTCRTDKKTGRKKCKACGREKGEKRSKYPSCRPTPSACGTKGKGEKWGKKSESKMKIDENQEMLGKILKAIENYGPELKDAHTNLKQGIDYLEILAKRDDLPEEKAAEIKKIAGKFIGVGHKNLKDLYDNVVRKRVQYQLGDKEHLEQIILALQNQDVLKDYISANNLLVKKESKMKINKEELKEIILQEVLAALSKEKSLEESVAYHLNAEVGFDKNIHRHGS